MKRRQFLVVAALSGPSLLAAESVLNAKGLRLAPKRRLGDVREEPGPTPIPDAKWYVAAEPGGGVAYSFPAGALAQARYVAADLFLDGKQKVVLSILLQEGAEGRKFYFRFSALNQCGMRLRMPLSLVDQNRWGIDREGAFLKPRVAGERVDLSKVDRMTFTVMRKGTEPARWSMTDLIVTEEEVALLEKPALPKGPLLDELGQSTIHDWPAKSRSAGEVTERIRRQLAGAPKQKWPDAFSRWGGWKAKRLAKGTGFFRTHHDGARWWLVDPDGYAFWSAGLDCVRVDTDACYTGLETALKWLPENDPAFRDALGSRPAAGPSGMKYIRYVATNMIRALGPEGWRDKWARIALAELRRLRFNTVGNWSEWEFAKAAAFPYVRPMSFSPRRVIRVYRDFPDVFHPDYEKDAADYAGILKDTVDDPAFIGYFLMNEPTWAFSSELPAAGMLYNAPACATRRELSLFLKKEYADATALSAAWGLRTDFDQIAGGKWTAALPKAALQDLEQFSVRMATRYFQTLSEACRKVDPHHLNLGMRWAGVPPAWAVEGMKSFDVFSMNCYMDKVPREVTGRIQALLGRPALIGEWHFGALDVGLPASGIGHLRNQVERARAYSVYLEDAAANPNCVGAHWFNLYDQSALGRFDGENYNIGFLDVCHRPYEEMCRAAVASHERMYEVASGKARPFTANLEYLPKLY